MGTPIALCICFVPALEQIKSNNSSDTALDFGPDEKRERTYFEQPLVFHGHARILQSSAILDRYPCSLYEEVGEGALVE